MHGRFDWHFERGASPVLIVQVSYDKNEYQTSPAQSAFTRRREVKCSAFSGDGSELHR